MNIILFSLNIRNEICYIDIYNSNFIKDLSKKSKKDIRNYLIGNLSTSINCPLHSHNQIRLSIHNLLVPSYTTLIHMLMCVDISVSSYIIRFDYVIPNFTNYIIYLTNQYNLNIDIVKDHYTLDNNIKVI